MLPQAAGVPRDTEVGTRGAHERYRSHWHQAGDREMIRNDAIAFMGPTPLALQVIVVFSSCFKKIILEVLKIELM
jgi:hypothetical protein